MRFVVLAIAVLIGQTNVVSATPPDMICEVNDTPASFTVILTTNYSNPNYHSIVPLSIHHSALTIDPAIQGFEPVKIDLYSEDLAGQWLMDGRVDLHIYKEEKSDSGLAYSLNLTIKTKSTGIQSEESGHKIHRGRYELQLYSGSKRDSTGKLIKQFGGDVVCG